MNDISEINDKTWDIGKQRADIIRPLAENSNCSQKMIEEAANQLQLSSRYIYKLIRTYRESHNIMTSLIPQKPSGGKGKTRLSELQELLIKNVIDKFYLTLQKLSPARIVEEIHKQCFEQNITKPSEASLRRRLRDIPLTQLRKRGVDNDANQAIIGSFPPVEYPLSIVQIDHTPVDIILVDPIERLPIGRPYLTIAIDIYSRCVPGFVLSLEAPSATSVGLCLTHIAMDKKPWLAERNIEAYWPIYGKPDLIHVDNGPDFHSLALSRGCAQHGIKIEYRPPGKAHYGGIVERIIGTMMNLVHSIPGTTFSNIEERGDYPSDAKACLTLAELECWLTIAITKYYHLRLHAGIHQPPIKRYEAGLELMKKNGKELSCIHNAKAFLIDFLPISYRTLRLDGFRLDHIVYFSNALKPLIAEKDKYDKFLIRRDNRDLSRIYVHLPNEKIYLEVSYRTISHPAISLFEHRLAVKRVKDLGKEQVHEAALFKAVDEIRSIVTQAKAKTRSVRRNRTRIEENKKAQPASKPSQNNTKTEENSTEAFTNIEVWD